MGPVQVHSDSSDFYVEPQMCLILYIETNLHTVSMHEPSFPSPRSIGDRKRVSGRPWLPFQGFCLFAPAGFLIPQPQDETQPCGFHLGLWPSHPSLATPRFFSALWKAFLGSWDFVQSLGVIIQKTASDFRKKKNKKEKMDLGPCRR